MNFDMKSAELVDKPVFMLGVKLLYDIHQGKDDVAVYDSNPDVSAHMKVLNETNLLVKSGNRYSLNYSEFGKGKEEIEVLDVYQKFVDVFRSKMISSIA